MKRCSSRLLALIALAGMLIPSLAWSAPDADAPSLNALARMPVKEITVFKDGHAFVLHQGEMPVDASGNVLMDYLPSPVLGTFWPFAADQNAKLTATTAGQRRVTVERSPLSIRELIEANIGAAVMITEVPAGRESEPLTYEATIVSVAERSARELEAVAPPNTGDLLPQKGEVVMLKTEQGVKAVNIGRIQDVTFKQPPSNACPTVEFRNLLTLQLDWNKRKPAATADVGLMYVQRGIRWIPNYKVTVDGKGMATIQLQATLHTELTDLENVTCHLVIGVPSFQFKDTVDPMALQQSLAQLSPYFRETDPTSGQYQMLSNAIMTQSARMGEYRGQPGAAPRGVDLGPELGGSENVEDLHMFTIRNLTLKKGQRMVVPVVAYKVPYRDIYVLDLPVAPPPEVWRHFNNQQQAQIAQLLAAPKVMHKIRLENKSDHPFTTAPALIVRNDRVLGQGLMTYTAKGGNTDLAITAAVDIQVRKTDKELERNPDAIRWQGDNYMRVNLEGTITLTNFRPEKAEVEIVRHVLGNITEADHDGKIEMVNILEDAAVFTASGGPYPTWWGWWSWPYWWNHFNGVGRITWTESIEPGKSAEFQYKWHYFWR
jgi:hypothetical protein